MIYWAGNITLLALLTFVLGQSIFKELDKRIYWSAFLLKLSAGIMLGVLFIHQYNGADSLRFFNLGTAILSGEQVVINQPRVDFFSRCLVPFIWITGGSYWLTALHLSTLSFYCYCYFVVTYCELYPKAKEVTILSFLFIPSVIFWSSGILKGVITNPALVCLVAISLKVYRYKRINFLEILLSVSMLILLYKIKHYLLISFLIYIALLMTVLFANRLRGLVKWTVILVIFGFSFLLTQNIHPYLRLERLAQTIYENNQAIYEKTSAEKRIELKVASPALSSILEIAPQAAVTGLFRPLFHDRTPPLGWFHKIENFLLLALAILSITLIVRKKPEADWQLIFISIFCLVFVATLLALTTPNFGSLVRYMNAITPFLFLITGILPFQYLSSKNH